MDVHPVGAGPEARTLRIGACVSGVRLAGTAGLRALAEQDELDAGAADDFAVTMDGAELRSDIRVDRITLDGPVRSHRFRAPPEESQAVGLLLPADGRLDVRGAGQSHSVRVGEGVALDRTHRWTYSCPGPLQLLRAAVPSAALTGRLLGRTTGRAIAMPPSALLDAYAGLLRSIVEHRDDASVGTWRLGRVLEQTTVAVLEEAMADEPLTRAEALRERIGLHIDRSIADPALDVASIAAALQISVRYVHRIFSTADITVARYIEERRLRGVAESLRSDLVRRSHQELAHDHGFRSADQLGRAFRRFYGVPITDFHARRDRYRT